MKQLEIKNSKLKEEVNQMERKQNEERDEFIGEIKGMKESNQKKIELMVREITNKVQREYCEQMEAWKEQVDSVRRIVKAGGAGSKWSMDQNANTSRRPYSSIHEKYQNDGMMTYGNIKDTYKREIKEEIEMLRSQNEEMKSRLLDSRQ